MRKNVSLLFVLFFLMASCLVISEPALSSDETKENTWTKKNPLLQEAGSLIAAVVNGRIFVIGKSFNCEYDPATDNWAEKTPMPTSRASFGVTTYQNKIYVIGGWEACTNEVYDILTNTWENKEPMPTNRTGITANVVKDKIHVLSTEGHDVYDIATASWTAEEKMPYATYNFGSSVFNDKIYVISWNRTQIYDTETKMWSIGAPSPISISSAAVCTTIGEMAPRQIYVFGGYTTWIYPINATQVYNPEADTWTLGASIPTPRVLPTAAVVNDSIHVIGGEFYWGRPGLIHEHYIYTPFGYGLIEPVVSVLSPQNKTYNENSVPLTFTVDKPVSWIQYSLDGQDNLTVTENTTLTDLPNGLHKITVYAKYAKGSIGASETTMFTVEVFPTTLTAVIIISISTVVASVALLFHFKKRKNNTADEL